MFDLSPEALQKILFGLMIVGFALMAIEDPKILILPVAFAGYVAIMRLLGL